MTEFSWHERTTPCLSPNPPLLYNTYSFFFAPLGFEKITFPLGFLHHRNTSP